MAGERRRIRDHWLMGTVFCGRCGSRLPVCDFHGNSGVYQYFFCLGRHSKRTTCDLPNLTPDQVEAAVADAWRGRVQLPPDVVETIRERLLADLARDQRQATRALRQLQERIQAIEHQRDVWAEKTASAPIPDDIGRRKQNELTVQLVRANHDLTLKQASDDISDVTSQALDLIRECAETYQRSAPALRLGWNQTFFAGIDVDVDRMTDARLKPPSTACWTRGSSSTTPALHPPEGRPAAKRAEGPHRGPPGDGRRGRSRRGRFE